MSAVMETVGFAPASPQATPHEAMLQAVRALADGPLAELADDIDRRGIYPKGILQRLGEVGAFKAHLGVGGEAPDFGAAIRAITEVSRVCGATGFMV